MQSSPGFATRPSSPARQAAIIAAAASLIALSAKTQVPFWPVPMTLHTLSVMLIAAALGPRIGVAAMSVYLGAGFMGLPIFAGSPERGVGLAYMVGPTGGYLAGYLIAAGVVGRLARRRGLIGCAGAMLAGLALVYALGLAWLGVFAPSAGVVAAGFAPFILGDLVKVALAAALATAWARTREARR